MTLGAVSLMYWRHHQITADEAQSAEKRTNFAGNGTSIAAVSHVGGRQQRSRGAGIDIRQEQE